MASWNCKGRESWLAEKTLHSSTIVVIIWHFRLKNATSLLEHGNIGKFNLQHRVSKHLVGY